MYVLKEEYVASLGTIIMNVILENLSQMNVEGFKPLRYLKFPFPPKPAKFLMTHPALAMVHIENITFLNAKNYAQYEHTGEAGIILSSNVNTYN